MATRHKILIVDDDPGVLELYRELLAELPSQPETFAANSGARALAMLKEEPFRLLICDLKMPKMDGLQVLAIVRRLFPELRTVVITGMHDEEYRSRAYALGVDLFWLKPDTQQNMEMFLQCIESLLGKDSTNGFRGIQSKGLMDLIQMECLSQSSTLLRITHGSSVGRLWIQSGELIDAECEGAKGEAAFQKILGWKSGTFENLPAEPTRDRAITKSVNALLLEAAQAMDETAQTPEGGPAQNPDEGNHRSTAWRLGTLSRAGAQFLVSLPEEKGEAPEGCGTETTQELAGWICAANDAFQRLTQRLHAGPLIHFEARSLDCRVVLLARAGQSYLVGWPGNAKPGSLIEASKQLVASWDS